MNHSSSKKIVIDIPFAKKRLDIFLSKKFPDAPRSFFQKEIKRGTILVNGKKALPSYKLKENDEVVFTESFSPFKKQEINLTPDEKIPFKIIFQNKDFAIIEKPAGISVHPSLKETSGTLVNGLLKKFPGILKIGEDPVRPGIVHRLDKFTSGILLIALNQKSFEFFKNSFKQRKIKKEYLAICWGILKNKQGIIESFIGKSQSNPAKQASNKNPEQVINPKVAKTTYCVLQEAENKSLILLSPSTGRKHQIRIHMQSIGHPLIGDFLYDNKVIRDKNKGFQRFMLHASHLSFVDQTGAKHNFISSPPEEFNKCWEHN